MERYKEILDKAKKEYQKTIDWFSKELLAFHGSRASIKLLENIKVECYGSQLSLKEVASLSLLDSRTVSIEPWDRNILSDIEKALHKAEIKGNVKTEKERVLFTFPALTAEDKEKILKVLRQLKERARESLRRNRDEAWSEIQEKQKEGELSEDEKFKAKDELEKLTKEFEEKIEEIEKKKEEEIMS